MRDICESSPETKIFLIYFSKTKYLLYISQSIYTVIPLSYMEWKDLSLLHMEDSQLPLCFLWPNYSIIFWGPLWNDAYSKKKKCISCMLQWERWLRISNIEPFFHYGGVLSSILEQCWVIRPSCSDRMVCTSYNLQLKSTGFWNLHCIIWFIFLQLFLFILK